MEKEKLTGVRAAAKERRQACRGRSNLPAMLRREVTAAASSTGMSGGSESRHRSEAGRRRGGLSVPLSGGEAQEAKEQGKKKALWAGGEKSKSTPVPVFIPQDQGRGECSTTPTVSVAGRHIAARSGAAVTVTVPLGHDALQ
jgi:hypothetical protein